MRLIRQVYQVKDHEPTKNRLMVYVFDGQAYVVFFLRMYDDRRVDWRRVVDYVNKHPRRESDRTLDYETFKRTMENNILYNLYTTPRDIAAKDQHIYLDIREDCLIHALELRDGHGRTD